MQFLGREDFLYDGLPTLGFYGQFSPLVQGYSCAESPFWLGKAFLCLHLPANHPFWTARENNGVWDVMGSEEIKETCLDGPALCFTNHGANGETILRTGKVLKRLGDERGMWNYAKLCYNTKYPWEAAPENEIPIEKRLLAGSQVEAQQYVINDVVKPENGAVVLKTDVYGKANVTFWCGQTEGILYRRQFFDYGPDRECHWIQAVNLADFPVPYGILRADKLRLYKAPAYITLGSYGFPDNGTEVIEKNCRTARAIVLKGRDARGTEKQMAMTIYDGWSDLQLLYRKGTNPDSEKSIVIYASMKRERQYGGFEPYVLISQVITKESHEDFSEEELFPIEEVVYADEENCGSYGPVKIKLKDGSVRMVQYEGVEGRLML